MHCWQRLGENFGHRFCGHRPFWGCPNCLKFWCTIHATQGDIDHPNERRCPDCGGLLKRIDGGEDNGEQLSLDLKGR